MMSNRLLATFSRPDKLLLREYLSSKFDTGTCDTTGSGICDLESITKDSDGPATVSLDRRLVCPVTELRLALLVDAVRRDIGSDSRPDVALVTGVMVLERAFSSASKGAVHRNG